MALSTRSSCELFARARTFDDTTAHLPHRRDAALRRATLIHLRRGRGRDGVPHARPRAVVSVA
eukprot:30893-Pelagococcus_subviridis.AAC.8